MQTLGHNYRWMLKGWNNVCIYLFVYVNIISVYYHRMIFTMVIHEPHMKDIHRIQNNTEQHLEPEKTQSKNMMTEANTLETTSQNHT